MGYKDFVSKTEDVVRLAYQLKYELGDKISINKIGLCKEILEGKFRLKDSDRYIDFSILYSDKEFLRVAVGEVGAYASSYEEKVFVLNELKNAISAITRNGVSLGEPSLFYNVKDEKYLIPHLEYIYTDKEETIKAFQDKTIFDDGTTPEDVLVFDFVEKNKEFLITKSYSYEIAGTPVKYDIDICAFLKNKSGIEEKELSDLIIDNLDEYFNKYSGILSYRFDISYIVNNIKKSLYLVDEKNLTIAVKKDGKNIFYVIYDKGILSYYGCHYDYKKCMIDVSYTPKVGVRFETKSDIGACNDIEDVVRNQFYNINTLNNTDGKNNIESNNNLLKLVRRIGNK